MTTSINQLRMNMLDTHLFQASKANKPTLEKILEEDKEKIFAAKGEDNYNEAMDFNGDGIVTYDEYMQYCEENAVAEYNSNPSYTFVSAVQNTDGQSIRPVHIGRALDTYSHFGEENLLPFVETEV